MMAIVFQLLASPTSPPRSRVNAGLMDDTGENAASAAPRRISWSNGSK